MASTKKFLNSSAASTTATTTKKAATKKQLPKLFTSIKPFIKTTLIKREIPTAAAAEEEILDGFDKLVRIPYDFFFSKPILNAVAFELEELIVCERPPLECRDVVLNILIEKFKSEKKLRKFGTWEPLAYKWYTAIRNYPGTEELEVMNANDLTIFGMISSTTRKIDLQNINFKTINDVFVASYPSVEELSVEGYFTLDQIAEMSIFNCFAFIARTFPNLKVLNFDFVCSTFHHHPEMYSTLSYINSSMFEDLPPNLQGNIHFKVKYDAIFFYNVIHLINPESGASINYQKKTFKKKFMIQDDLSFKCKVHFEEV